MESTFTKSSDTRHKIKLESNLIYALWSFKQAHAGQEATFEVRTSLVGNGAKIKATCWTESGKKLDKIEATMSNNKFTGTLLIPEKCKPDEMIYFDVELPKHGLKDESNSIPVRPVIKVSKMQWDRKEVKREEIVMLTCQFESGVEDGDEAMVVIYEHNPNSCDLKVVSIPTVIKDNKVEMQWEFDYQDDTLLIATHAEMQSYNKNYHNPDFFFVVVVDGVRVGEKRESGLMKFNDWAVVEYRAPDGKTILNKKYVVIFSNGDRQSGVLDSNGLIRLETVVPGKIIIEFPD